jgi:ubiquinone/menaquinone biosynthesis C-methylase UbiE
MNLAKNQEKAVREAFTILAKKRKNWPNKYNIGLQLSKMLSDYSLMRKIDLIQKRVLNVGCSEPIDELFWINLVKEWIALDINEEAIKTAKKLATEALPSNLLGKIRFTVGDATNLQFKDECYDVVVSFSTIDHIPDKANRANALKEMCRVLKKSGYLVVTIPNRWDIIYSYRSNKMQRGGKAVYGYEYQFSPLELKKLLTMSGFKIVDCASTSFNPNSYFDRLLRRLGLVKIKTYLGTRFGYLAEKL